MIVDKKDDKKDDKKEDEKKEPTDKFYGKYKHTYQIQLIAPLFLNRTEKEHDSSRESI